MRQEKLPQNVFSHQNTKTTWYLHLPPLFQIKPRFFGTCLRAHDKEPRIHRRKTQRPGFLAVVWSALKWFFFQKTGWFGVVFFGGFFHLFVRTKPTSSGLMGQKYGKYLKHLGLLKGI